MPFAFGVSKQVILQYQFWIIEQFLTIIPIFFS